MKLTPRQNQVLALFAHGKDRSEVMEDLKLSKAAVDYHLLKAYATLGVSSLVEALISGGFIKPTELAKHNLPK